MVRQEATLRGWERLQCGSRIWKLGSAPHGSSFSCGASARRGAQVIVQRPAGQETRRGRSPGTN